MLDANIESHSITSFVIFTRGWTRHISINPDFHPKRCLICEIVVWEYFHMLNMITSPPIRVSCNFHTSSSFHLIDFRSNFHLIDFCLTFARLHGVCGKVFPWSISLLCCRICAWTINANEPINIWKRDHADENYTLIVYLMKSFKGSLGATAMLFLAHPRYTQPHRFILPDFWGY